LLFFDTLRGFDSTGVFGVDKHANVEIHKAALNGLEFIQQNEFKSFKNFLSMKAMFAVGHNRAATRGSVNDKNAHPFWEQDKIVLVQNGTYRGSHKHLKDTEVDTEAVAHVLAEEPNVETALKKINAAYALVWFNTETKTLNLIRNNERPLWLLGGKQGALIWASEPGMIFHAARRNNFDWGENKATELPAHTLVSLKIDGNKWEREDQELDCSYTFPVQQQYQWPEEDTDHNVLAGWPYHRQQQQWVGRPALPNYTTRAGRQESNREDVTLTMNQAVADHYTDYHYKPNEGLAAVEAVNGLERDKKHIVEVIDYIAANEHSGCTTWHIMAQFVQADASSPAHKVVCHWFMYNCSENEVMEYTKHGFYKGAVANTKLITYNEKYSVVTTFLNDIEPMNISSPAAMVS
jgi:hypothetical protein